MGFSINRAVSIALIGAFALALMGSKGACESSSGAVSVPVAVGMGPLPYEASAGTWVRVGHSAHPSGAAWAFTAAGAAGVALAAAAKAADKQVNVIHANVVSNPCYGRKASYKIARWARFTRPSGYPHAPMMGADYDPYLNCGGLSNLVSRYGWPARLKWVYDCIANLFANGFPTAGPWGYGWGAEGGSLVTTFGGRVKEVDPAFGSWKRCADWV